MNRNTTKSRKRNNVKRNRKGLTLVTNGQPIPLTSTEMVVAENRAASQVSSQELHAEAIRNAERGQQEAACWLITRATERQLATLATQERGLALGIDNKLVQLIQHDESISFLRDTLTNAAFARVITTALRCTAAGIEAAHFANERLRVAA